MGPGVRPQGSTDVFVRIVSPAQPIGAAVRFRGPKVRAWALAVAALIFLMTIVGGATRLTESGLSITQWKPISGVIPPLSAADWQAEFDGYKQIPQFKLMRPDMTLDAFKAIFWWEWAHRFLARVIGAAFILPALWFWARGALKGRARPMGGAGDRLSGAGADRRLVDGRLRASPTASRSRRSVWRCTC